MRVHLFHLGHTSTGTCKASAKGGQGRSPYFEVLAPPTSNDPYHQYTTSLPVLLLANTSCFQLKSALEVVIFMLKVGRPGFVSLAESDQKTLKVGIHSQGNRQKNFQGRATEKIPKIAKNTEK